MALEKNDRILIPDNERMVKIQILEKQDVVLSSPTFSVKQEAMLSAKYKDEKIHVQSLMRGSENQMTTR